jgi:hypothetical protein
MKESAVIIWTTLFTGKTIGIMNESAVTTIIWTTLFIGKTRGITKESVIITWSPLFIGTTPLHMALIVFVSTRMSIRPIIGVRFLIVWTILIILIATELLHGIHICHL